MRDVLVVVTVLVVAALAGACSEQDVEPIKNVRPPRPGTPAAPADVQGIYRSIHQAVLQLRGDGSFVLIVPEGPGPSAGSFTLRDGRLSVRTSSCDDDVGTYDVVVTGKQEAGKAALHITAVDDACADRRRYLTVDPWVYANS